MNHLKAYWDFMNFNWFLCMMQRVIQFITLALFWLRGRFYRKINSRFSHDVTKIQTKKLSLLLSFYFHVILEHLKTFIQTNFQFTRILRFAIQDAWISRLLRDAAFSSRAKKALMWVKNIADFWRFCYLNIPCLRINIPLIFMSFSIEEFTHK